MFWQLSKKRLTKAMPKEAIDGIVQRYISPTLSESGYVKHGRTWTKKEAGFTKVISVQASRWNGPGASFVVNYGIYVPALYKVLFSPELPANPKIYDCQFSNRLEKHHATKRGIRMFFAREIWWEISDSTDTNKLGIRLISALEDQCLALFSSITTLNDIIESHNILFYTHSRFERAVLLAETGNSTAQGEFLAALLEKGRQDKYYERVCQVSKNYGYSTDIHGKR